MDEKETVSDWGVHLLRHLQILMVSFLVTKLKCNHFYGRLPKQLKAMVAYLKASAHEKMYSNCLWVAREVEKEEAMEPSHSQTTNKTSKARWWVSVLCKSWKACSLPRPPAVRAVHLEEDGFDEEVGTKSEGSWWN